MGQHIAGNFPIQHKSLRLLGQWYSDNWFWSVSTELCNWYPIHLYIIMSLRSQAFQWLFSCLNRNRGWKLWSIKFYKEKKSTTYPLFWLSQIWYLCILILLNLLSIWELWVEIGTHNLYKELIIINLTHKTQLGIKIKTLRRKIREEF